MSKTTLDLSWQLASDIRLLYQQLRLAHDHDTIEFIALQLEAAIHLYRDLQDGDLDPDA